MDISECLQDSQDQQVRENYIYSTHILVGNIQGI